jgi:protein phosphatase
MAKLVVRVGACTSQGVRANNEDFYFAEPGQDIFLVADGMGGQDRGEEASRLAAEIIPRAFHQYLAAHGDAGSAVAQALEEANRAIIDAGQDQALGRRMGTTAVLAVYREDRVWVAGLGDSRAYLIRAGRVEQLTVDHTVAEAYARSGALTAEQARHSPFRHVLYNFLGCPQMREEPDVRPFTPQAGDRLVLASDGLTGHVSDDDLRAGPALYPDPAEWSAELVRQALDRGSRDNVTCVVLAFDEVDSRP